MIAALLGGTLAMRAAGKEFLPQEPGETQNDYQNRLNRSVLFNQLARTLGAATGKVFKKPLMLPDLPAPMVSWIEDIDLEGNHLDQLARRWFEDGAAYGVSFMMVDAPRSPIPASQRTLADDAALGIRPYLVHVPCLNLIGWRHEQINGRWVLTQARIREDTFLPFDEFSETAVDRVRVLERGRYRLYQRGYDERRRPIATLIEEGETGLDFIPLLPFYTNRTGRFTSLPPLSRLAELNIRHWQSSSDQANILRVARVPMLHVSKHSDAEAEKPQDVVLGANSVFLTGVDENVEYVEHSGAAISAGRQDILDLQDQMEKVGWMLTPRQTTGDVTATENSLVAAEANAALTTMSENFKDALEQAFKMMATMGGIIINGQPAEPSVILPKEFGSVATAGEMPFLTDMFGRGALTKSTLLSEAKRRGVLQEDVDVPAIVAATGGEMATEITQSQASPPAQ